MTFDPRYYKRLVYGRPQFSKMRLKQELRKELRSIEGETAMFDEFESIKREVYQASPCTHGEPKARSLIFSDISQNLPVLEYYASRVNHVTEFGVRDGHSTLALIAGCKGEVHSYDIQRTPIIGRLGRMNLPCSWSFTQLDTVSPFHAHVVKETDLLFIDTLHVYEHVKRELELHGRKARRFLVFHDTTVCWLKDLSGPDPEATGIGRAILEFLEKYHGQYVQKFQTHANNGLLVLERYS